MKGKWAQGLRPRAFIWVIKDRIGASERPGGYARNHRKVRRDEELIWLQQNGFTHVLSLLDSPHNLAAYDEAGIRYAHVPLGRPGAEAEALPRVYETLLRWYRDPSELVLVHHEEFGDRLCGVVGGFLLAAGLLDSGPTAVAVTERLTGRQLGPDGRSIVRLTIEEGLAPRVREEPPAPPARAVPEAAKKKAKKKAAPAKKRVAAAPKRKRTAPAVKKKATAPRKKAAPKKAAPKRPAVKKKTAPAKRPATKAAPARKPAAKKPAAVRKAPRKKTVARSKAPASARSATARVGGSRTRTATRAPRPLRARRSR